MPQPTKNRRAQTESRVYERFECFIRLREGAPSSKPRSFRGHEVQASAPEARSTLAVDIHLWSESHFFCGLSGDISQGGVFISTYLPFPVGSAVDLEFSLPGTDAVLQACGEVRWVRDHSHHGPRGIGVAFEQLSEQDREAIHEFCTVRPALYYDDVG